MLLKKSLEFFSIFITKELCKQQRFLQNDSSFEYIKSYFFNSFKIITEL